MTGHEHVWGPWKTEYPGTCVRQGMNVRVCSVCGKEEYVYSGLGDHEWGEWQTVKEPAATEDGLRQRVCKNDSSHVETQTIPAGNGQMNPAIDVFNWADEGAGDGKRYLGAVVPLHFETTNTGDCPLYVYWWPALFDSCHDSSAPHGRTEIEGMGSVALLYPGETYTETEDYHVNSSDVVTGFISASTWGAAFYYDANGEIQVIGENSNKLYTPVTFPTEGEGPHPSLTVTISPLEGENAGEGKRYEGAMIPLLYEATNTGDCPLYVVWWPDMTQYVYNASAPNAHEVVEGMNDGFEVTLLNPGETVVCDVPDHAVTEYEAQVLGSVTNIATAKGSDLQGGEHTWPSNAVSVPTSPDSPVPVPPALIPGGVEKDDPGAPVSSPIEVPEEIGIGMDDQQDGDAAIPGNGDEDHCGMALSALGDREIRYTLHDCTEHAAIALRAAKADPADAAAMWREAIDKLYQALLDAAPSEETKAAVTDDQAAFWAYADAFRALYDTRLALLTALYPDAPEIVKETLMNLYRDAAIDATMAK